MDQVLPVPEDEATDQVKSPQSGMYQVLPAPAEADELVKEQDSQLAEQEIETSAKDKSLKETLKRLYDDYSQGRFDAPSLRSDEREVLHRDLGWFGDLALAPEGESDQEARDKVLQPAILTAIGVPCLIASGLLAALAGLFGLIFLIICFYSG